MRVALLHPRSGPAGLWAPGCSAAATVAAAEINAAGGILGDEIEIVFADCGLSERQAMSSLETLLEVEDVDAVIGSHTSNLRDPISRRLAGRAPYVYTPQYEGIPCGPSTVAIGSFDSELMAPALNWLITERRAQRFFFVGNEYIWPRMAMGVTKRLVKRYNLEFLGEAFMPFGRTDHEQVLQQIKRLQPDVVVMALVGDCAITFNRAYARAGLDAKALRYALVVDETVVCGIGADATENLYTSANYFANQRSNSNDRFLELYHEAFGTLAPPVTAGSIGCYEGLHVLAGLAREHGSRDRAVLANLLQRPMGRAAARHPLGSMPVGQYPQVHVAAVDGLSFRVIASVATH